MPEQGVGRGTGRWFWVSGSVIVSDQATKLAADHYLQLHDSIPVLPFFNIVLAYNTGAAFSILSESGGWQRWFLTILALAISTVIVVWIHRLDPAERWTALSLALILGGALGNVIDRMVYGHVIDFVQLYYEQWYWPAFNVADSSISIGVTILLVDALLGDRKKP